MRQLTELFGSTRPFHPAELTTALETAVLKKSDEYSSCVRLLLKKGANPGGVNGLGTPYLYIAADAGCIGIVDLLLQAKCDPNQCKDDGSTALHRAVTNNHIDVVEKLIQGDAELELRDVQGRTPLILAAQRNRLEILELLLRCDCDCDAKDKKVRTALYWAARYNYQGIVYALLDTKADIDVCDWEMNSPLMRAAEYGHADIVEILLDHDADPDLVNYHGMSALMLATTNKHLHCVNLLIDFGADVNIRDTFGASPLMYLMDSPSMVYHLLEAGADPNVTTFNTYLSPPLIAIADNSFQSLRILIQSNCYFTRVIKDGHTEKRPLDEALKRGYIGCVQLLFLASVSVGADLAWLKRRLKNWPGHSTQEQLSLVMKCHLWLIDQMKEIESVPSLFSITLGKLRKCIHPMFFEDNVNSLPLPCVLKNSIKLKALDSVKDIGDK